MLVKSREMTGVGAYSAKHFSGGWGRAKDDRLQYKIHWPRWFSYKDVSHSNKEGRRDIQREVKSVENDWDNETSG